MTRLVSLEHKRILVTGASSGIGMACARLAAELGASVVATGRNEARLATLSDIAETSVGDVTNPAFINELADICGRLDGLVHAAGLSSAVPLRMIDIEDVRKVYETNAFAFIRLMKTFANRRLANPGFSTVAISSVAALAGWNGVTAYAGSKGAVNAMVRSLAVELASQRFRVNAVCPSNIQTPMLDELTHGLDRQQVMDMISRRQPLGVGSPEQVAAPVCFLLSDAASFITGVSLPVDGGYLAQ